MKYSGFTLIELLITIGLIVIIAVLTFPVGAKFYAVQAQDEAAYGIFSTLRRAYSQAVFQKNDSVFGVKLLSGSYILFRGASYVSRIQNADEQFTLSSGITTSGLDEIVFTKYSGTTTQGTVYVGSSAGTSTIEISSLGKIEIQ